MPVNKILCLILDDDPEEAEMLAEKLEMDAPGRYEFSLVSTIKEGLQVMKAREFDALLVDYNLGKGHGGTFLYMASLLRPAAHRVLITGFGVGSLARETQIAIQDKQIHYLNKNDLIRINLHDYLENL